MELLHTQEEIKYYDKLTELVNDLKEMNQKYNLLKEDLNNLINQYDNEIQLELDKYLPFIGKKYLAPPSSYSEHKEWRIGTLISVTHFNAFSHSIRGNFKYDNGGFDGHSLLELKEIN